MLVAMTAANITKWIAWGRVVVHEIHGWNNQATNLYIQLHQEPVVTNGDVPQCKSLLALASDGFMYNFGTQGIELSELLVGISTTETNYTAVGANGGLDMTLDVDTQFAIDGTELIAGDLTTAQNALQVWSEATGAAGAQRLLRVDIKNNEAATKLYNLVYAVDTVSPSTSGIESFNACPANATTTTYYGDGQCGFSPFQQDKSYTGHRGCTINVSNAPTPGTVWGGTLPNIRAIYKPVSV